MAATTRAPQFSCHVAQHPSGAVVAPRGELDLATVGTLQSAIDDLIRDGARTLVVDLTGLTFVDSTGLRCLMTLASRSRSERFGLELVPGPDAVMRLFDLTATRDLLPFRSAA